MVTGDNVREGKNVTLQCLSAHKTVICQANSVERTIQKMAMSLYGYAWTANAVILCRQ
jgi:hypothetical protein